MIEAQHISKWFGPTLAVDDVSLKVERGEVQGFLGPNGAGKSTTMRMITGFLPLSAGSVTIGGHDIEEDPIAAKSLVGYLPENAPAYPEMSVEGFLRFAAEIRGLRGRQVTEAVERAIRTCFLERVRYQSIDTLSKGYLHRSCFAQAILHDPPVLVMDEPTDGLDPNQKHEVRELIKEMGKTKAIIVSTHILEEVEAICTGVVIIDRGRLVFRGTPAELKARSALAGAVSCRVFGPSAEELMASLRGVSGGGAPEVLASSNGGVAVRVPPAAEGGDGLARRVCRLFVEKGWEFDELHTEGGRLDEVFRAVTLPDTVQENGA
ncbi:MAG: ATP-binding cassette domain-containing protein [Lentisphaeria bacterium]|nr:ATP-binding cassette domain-containing protein [Lentisphaeria bacterium]